MNEDEFKREMDEVRREYDAVVYAMPVFVDVTPPTPAAAELIRAGIEDRVLVVAATRMNLRARWLDG